MFKYPFGVLSFCVVVFVVSFLVLFRGRFVSVQGVEYREGGEEDDR